MKKTVIILIAIAFIAVSCRQTNNKTEGYSEQNVVYPSNAYYLRYKFVDSTQVGKEGSHKIEILTHENDSTKDCFVKIFCYKRYKGGEKKDWWLSCNEFIFDGVMLSEPEISDYNNDGYNDFAYESLYAARSANIVRKLFIYDPENDEFIYIKNSENFPNLAYNKELNCITSLMVYGCYATVFLTLQNDSLKRFASVELCGNGELTVNEFDKYGNEKMIKHEMNNDFNLIDPFKNYKPLKQ